MAKKTKSKQIVKYILAKEIFSEPICKKNKSNKEQPK